MLNGLAHQNPVERIPVVIGQLLQMVDCRLFQRQCLYAMAFALPGYKLAWGGWQRQTAKPIFYGDFPIGGGTQIHLIRRIAKQILGRNRQLWRIDSQSQERAGIQQDIHDT